MAAAPPAELDVDYELFARKLQQKLTGKASKLSLASRKILERSLVSVLNEAPCSAASAAATAASTRPLNLNATLAQRSADIESANKRKLAVVEERVARQTVSLDELEKRLTRRPQRARLPPLHAASAAATGVVASSSRRSFAKRKKTLVSDRTVLSYLGMRPCDAASTDESEPVERSKMQIDAIVQRLRLLDTFASERDVYYLQLLASSLGAIEYPVGRSVFRQGDMGLHWYIVFSGCVQVIVVDEAVGQERIVATVRAGGNFGDIALRTTAPRAASVVCCEPTVLLTLAKSDYDLIVSRYHQRRVMVMAEFLKRFRVFDDYRLIAVKAIADVVLTRTFAQGDVVVEEGAPIDFLYFIQQGQVQAEKAVHMDGRGTYWLRLDQPLSPLIAFETFPNFTGAIGETSEARYRAASAELVVCMVASVSLRPMLTIRTRAYLEEYAARRRPPTADELKAKLVAKLAQDKWDRQKRKILADVLGHA